MQFLTNVLKYVHDLEWDFVDSAWKTHKHHMYHKFHYYRKKSILQGQEKKVKRKKKEKKKKQAWHFGSFSL